MKKTLLALFTLAAATLGAQADIAYFNSTGNTGSGTTFTGDFAHEVTMSGTTDKTGDDALVSKSFNAPGACTVTFGMGSNNNNAPGIGTWGHFRIYANNIITIAPADGVTITGVTLRCSGSSYAKGFTTNNNGTFSYNSSNYTYTLSCSTTDNLVITSSGTSRVYYMLVEYTGGVEAVKVVTFSQPSGFVNAGTEISLSSETDNATIYYTTNGEDPTSDSSVYSQPIKIDGYTVIKAYAVKTGMTDSSIATAIYGVLPINEDATTVTYNFADITTLSPEQTTDGVDTTKGIEISDITFTADAISLNCNTAESSTPSRIWVTSAGVTNLRLYAKSTITLTAKDAKINYIDFGADISATITTGNGYIIGSKYCTEIPDDEVVLTLLGNLQTNNISVNYEPNSSTSAIADIAADEAAAPAEYFNLQGQRVANPAAGGLYIVRQGSKVSKVIL